MPTLATHLMKAYRLGGWLAFDDAADVIEATHGRAALLAEYERRVRAACEHCVARARQMRRCVERPTH